MVIQHDGKAIELFSGGKFSINQEIGRFSEGRVLCQLLHGNAPVTQNSLFPVHKSNCALTAACIGIARIQRNDTGLFFQGGNINGLLSLGAGDNR